MRQLNVIGDYNYNLNHTAWNLISCDILGLRDFISGDAYFDSPKPFMSKLFDNSLIACRPIMGGSSNNCVGNLSCASVTVSREYIFSVSLLRVKGQS